MDKLPPLGRVIPETIGPTYKIYGDILQQPRNAEAIQQTKREEFSYGDHPRQKLDLYSTPASTSSPRKVLIFLYGGGFVTGDKRLEGIPDDLAYANLGSFFSSEKYGFDTVIMDYRLLSHGAKYPSGAEDLDLCLQWVIKHFGNDVDISFLGNSAGAAHTCFWLFGEKWADSRRMFHDKAKGPTTSKVGLLGCPFRLDPEGGMKSMLQAYFGEPETTKMSEPTSLMLKAVEGLSQKEVDAWPDIRVMLSEYDPEPIIKGASFYSLSTLPKLTLM
jgi:hypothetical protein